MSDDIEVRTSSTEIIGAIARMLSVFGDRSQTVGMPNLYHGVSVTQKADEPDIHRFTLRTPDALEVGIEVDFRALSRDYIDGLIAQLRHDLSFARRERNAIPENIITSAVREAIS